MIRALFQQIEMHPHKQISTHSPQTALLSPTCLHTAASRYTQSRYTQHSTPAPVLCAQQWDGAGGEQGDPNVSHEATGHNTPLSLCAPAEKCHRAEKCHGQVCAQVSEPGISYHRDALSNGKSPHRGQQTTTKTLLGTQTLLESRRGHRAQLTGHRLSLSLCTALSHG